MKSENINSQKDKNPQPEKRMGHIPQTKIFKFPESASIEEMEAVMNPWIWEATMALKQPQPGKAFSNHKTGEIYVIFIYLVETEYKPVK